MEGSSCKSAIMRAFVQMRKLAASNREMATRFVELERRVGKHDQAIGTLFDAIRQMMQVEGKGWHSCDSSLAQPSHQQLLP